MYNFTLNLLTIFLGLAVMSMAKATPTAHKLLMAQIRLGEDIHREDLVEQSLYRLELAEPDNPDVVAARFRYLLRKGDIEGAQKQLARLSLLAPDSKIYKASRTAMRLSSPEGRQALQMARLQAISGRHKEAIDSYDKLFNGAPPDIEMALEYWGAMTQIASRRNEAIRQLKILNIDNPDSGAIFGALGQAYSQNGDRANAVANLEKALALDPNSSNNDKWNSLLKVNRYWLAIQQGDAALKANNPDRAERLFQQARNVDNTDSYAVLGLGDVAMARKDYPAAERYYQQTLRMDSGNTNAVRGLANLYRQQSPEKAEAFIASLSASQRRSIDDIERSLQNDRLAQQAEALENQGKWAQAAALQRQRLALDPGSVWITYRLSQDLWQAGQRSQADTLMRHLAQQKPNDPEQVYAYGLYLSGHDQDRAALAHINSLPRAQWNSNIQELVNRLQSDQVLETASRLRESGKEAEAEAMLRQQPPSTRIDLTLADWAQQRRDDTAARAAYQNVLTQEPANVDAILGLTEVDIAAGDKAAARSQLAKLPATNNASLNTQRRVALAQAQLGDTAAAQQTFNQLIPLAKSQPPSMESAMVLRDGARFEAQTGEPKQALETYKDAMVAAGVTPARPQDNDTFTRLTRNDEKDDWLKRGVRSDAADLYRQQDLNITLEHDYWGSSGTGGYSDLKAHTTMLQVDAPYSDGRMFFRSDFVNMNVGSFSADAEGKWDNNWGTCTLQDCSAKRSQSDSGASVAVGWRNDVWSWDIGTT
ncbi:cellulose synthase complex outer membrane protein BcsC, partial [Escherichia coli]|uniref:cellulose synthase complex outer membrane protein BcsC n=3 Tax=Escherichia coli TaxID=562 RepID=UPI000B7E13B6